MTTIKKLYVCPACQRHHDARAEAEVCCASQEEVSDVRMRCRVVDYIGAAVIAERLEITPGAVCQWRTKKIPKRSMHVMQLLWPRLMAAIIADEPRSIVDELRAEYGLLVKH